MAAADLTLVPLPSVYDPTPNRVAGVLESSSLPLSFETAQGQWTYVVSFARADPDRLERHRGPLVVRVTLEVTSGRIGVGVARGAGPDFVDEVVLLPGPGAVAELLASNAATAGDLIVRNAFRKGASRGRILAVETFALEFDLWGVREPGLSSPTPTPGWSRYYGNSFDRVIEKLRAQGFDGLTTPEIVRWCDGLSFRVVPNDQVSRAMFTSGTYEPNTLGLLRRFLRPGQVCIDVGANAGVFTVVAAHCVGSSGHVYSFEPSQREHLRLCDAVGLNRMEAQVTPILAAVGAEAGHLELRVASPPHTGLNTLAERFPYEGVGVSRLERVEVVTLDAFARRQALTAIDLIKIDVEGAEAAVLAGAIRVLRHHRPVLIIEVFSRSLALNGASVMDVQRHLREADYRLFGIDDETAELIPIDDLTTIDEQNVVALPSERA